MIDKPADRSPVVNRDVDWWVGKRIVLSLANDFLYLDSGLLIYKLAVVFRRQIACLVMSLMNVLFVM